MTKTIPLKNVELMLRGRERVQRYEIEHQRMTDRMGKIEGTEAIRNYMKLEAERKEKERIAYEVERQRQQMIRDLEDPQSELFDPLRASKIKKEKELK